MNKIEVYCIALEGEGLTGVDWYWSKEDRDAELGTNAATEIPFDWWVPAGATVKEITDLVDDVAWTKEYEVSK